MRADRFSIASALFLLFAAALPTSAAIVMPNSITIRVPSGTSDPDGVEPYTDDVFLDTLTFGSETLDVGTEPFVSGVSVYVASGRENINAEWGPDDDAADGDTDPFTRAGLDPADQESTDPAIQDAGLASSFFSLSLNEGSDGEGQGMESVMHLTFAEGIRDDANGLPELILFERGNNDDNTRIQAITGGTFENPTFAPNTVTINAGDLWDSGISIQTNEIDEGQELGVGGIDLGDFGIGAETPVFGFAIASTGADFFGQVLGAATDDPNPSTTETPEDLLNPDGSAGTTQVPEPAAWGLLSGILAFAAVVCRRDILVSK